MAAAKKSDSKLSRFVGEVRSLKKRTVVYGSHREAYLKGLFDTVYGADIVERFAIENPFALDQLVKELASAVGSLTNPSKLANTLNTVAHAGATDKTVKRYLDALTDAFIFSEVERFDVKGKRYFDYPMKCAPQFQADRGDAPDGECHLQRAGTAELRRGRDPLSAAARDSGVKLAPSYTRTVTSAGPSSVALTRTVADGEEMSPAHRA